MNPARSIGAAFAFLDFGSLFVYVAATLCAPNNKNERKKEKKKEKKEKKSSDIKNISRIVPLSSFLLCLATTTVRALIHGHSNVIIKIIFNI